MFKWCQTSKTGTKYSRSSSQPVWEVWSSSWRCFWGRERTTWSGPVVFNCCWSSMHWLLRWGSASDLGDEEPSNELLTGSWVWAEHWTSLGKATSSYSASSCSVLLRVKLFCGTRRQHGDRQQQPSSKRNGAGLHMILSTLLPKIWNCLTLEKKQKEDPPPPNKLTELNQWWRQFLEWKASRSSASNVIKHSSMLSSTQKPTGTFSRVFRNTVFKW